jgi:hypothetical protein
VSPFRDAAPALTLRPADAPISRVVPILLSNLRV